MVRPLARGVALSEVSQAGQVRAVALRAGGVLVVLRVTTSYYWFVGVSKKAIDNYLYLRFPE